MDLINSNHTIKILQFFPWWTRMDSRIKFHQPIDENSNQLNCVLKLTLCHILLVVDGGASVGIMVSKLVWQTYGSELESHWVAHSFGLVPHLDRKLSKLLIVVTGLINTYFKKMWIVSCKCFNREKFKCV